MPGHIAPEGEREQWEAEDERGGERSVSLKMRQSLEKPGQGVDFECLSRGQKQKKIESTAPKHTKQSNKTKKRCDAASSESSVKIGRGGGGGAGTNQRAGGRRSGLSGGRRSTQWTGPEEERPPDWCRTSPLG